MLVSTSGVVCGRPAPGSPLYCLAGRCQEQGAGERHLQVHQPAGNRGVRAVVG